MARIWWDEGRSGFQSSKLETCRLYWKTIVTFQLTVKPISKHNPLPLFHQDWYNAPRALYYASHEKRVGPPTMDQDDTASYSGRGVLFPRTSRENPVSMLRLKKMSMMRLKKDNGDASSPVESDEFSAPLRLAPISYYTDNGDLVNKRMSMMRLKKPSMMRLRRMPSSNAVSMLRLKKAVTQLRLKKDAADEMEAAGSENDCLWYNDRCLNLNKTWKKCTMREDFQPSYSYTPMTSDGYWSNEEIDRT